MAQANPIRRETDDISPMFYVPDGVDELFYSDEQSVVDTEEDNEPVEISDTFVSEDDINHYDGPETPDIIGLTSQTVRTSNTGNQVIDVVIEVEDIPGIENYEFRVTKI